MASVPAGALPVDMQNMSAGFHGEIPPSAVPLGASPELRNVTCANGEVVTEPGWQLVSADAANANKIVHISQVYRSPFVNGDPVVVVTKDRVKYWNPDSGNWDTIASSASNFLKVDEKIRPSSTLDHDGNWILATGREGGIYWWPLGGYFLPDGTEVIPESTSIPPHDLVVLPGLDDERVNIRRAFVARHFEPHVILMRLKVGVDEIPNRYWWSDTNSSTRWFVGFDDATSIESVAGFADLPADIMHETPTILDGQPLRDLFIIYTAWQIYTLQFVGAPLMWVRRMVQGECGLWTSDCCINFGDRHYFYGRDGDFWAFNGTDKQSIGAPIRDYVNSNRVGLIYGFREFLPDCACWAFSTSADTPTVPDTVVKFNTRDGSWTISDFPFTAARAIDPSGLDQIAPSVTWDSAVGTWDAATGAWDDQGNDPQYRDATSADLDKLVMGSSTGFLYYRTGWDAAGSARVHSWKSGVLDFGEDLHIKHLSAINVTMVKKGLVNQGQDTPAANYAVTINVRAANNQEDVPSAAILQSRQIVLNDGQSSILPFRVTQRYMQFEVTSTSSENDARPWALRQLTFYVVPMGTR